MTTSLIAFQVCSDLTCRLTFWLVPNTTCQFWDQCCHLAAVVMTSRVVERKTFCERRTNVVGHFRRCVKCFLNKMDIYLGQCRPIWDEKNELLCTVNISCQFSCFPFKVIKGNYWSLCSWWGGRIAQWIAFSLHTQQPRVQFFWILDVAWVNLWRCCLEQ